MARRENKDGNGKAWREMEESLDEAAKGFSGEGGQPRTSDDLFPEQQSRDYQARSLTLANIRRIRVMSWLVIGLMVFLNVMFLVGRNEVTATMERPVWNYLLFLRSSWIVAALAFLAFAGRPRGPESITKRQRIMAVAFPMLGLTFTALQSGLGQTAIPFVTAHVLAAFTIAALIYLSTRQALLVFLPPTLLLALLLVINQVNPSIRLIHLVNLSVLTVLALLISRINYQKEVRDIHRERLIKLQNVELERLSFVDGLTGVFNRRRLDLALNEEWRRAARRSESLALLMADIDHFKAYNDALGHQAGDDALIKVARALDQTVRRQGDMVTRYGGEEFAVLLPDTDPAGATQLAQAMRRRVESLGIEHPGAPNGILTVSLGAAACMPLKGGLPEDLVTAADKALYRAKQAGRNRVETA